MKLLVITVLAFNVYLEFEHYLKNLVSNIILYFIVSNNILITDN